MSIYPTQQYLFNTLRVEPMSKVEVEYDDLKLIGIIRLTMTGIIKLKLSMTI
jgi:hypothetical protein